ncbi:hypothetical protein [Novosphingobium pokkalii]|uniref:Uncharacterized protein n=1 Tax=Novosphingobium pokkalii TaxID=1770194 RepID=A0ABV7V0A3_9SPHN|nr:hypothetical protein [Novosphingobium pokkalii]
MIFSGRAGGRAVAAKELQALTQTLETHDRNPNLPVAVAPRRTTPRLRSCTGKCCRPVNVWRKFPTHCYAAGASGGGTAGSAMVNAPACNGLLQDFCVLTECGGFLPFFRIDALAMADQM